jgi:hypothetical protein
MTRIEIERLEVRLRGSSVTTAEAVSRAIGPAVLEHLAAQQSDAPSTRHTNIYQIDAGVVRVSSGAPASITDAAVQVVGRAVASSVAAERGEDGGQ